jgi:8-oxo-dGTP pyrophosphatase MutT (NUDIX family)/ribosomal protein S27AE
MKIIGEIIHDQKTHSYCPKCWNNKIQAYLKNGKEYYHCGNCGYDDSRLFEFYPQLRYQILDNQELLHYSVGAIIVWEEKLLLFRRRLFPFKYTIIAGHWDLTDSSADQAIIREIKEEAGIEVTPNTPIITEMLNEPCRRGADFHEWRLYQFKVNYNQATMSEEADIIGWYSPDEIKKLELTIPTEYFLKKLNIL